MMSHQTPSCAHCGSPSETSHYDPVPLTCSKGHRFEARWPTHGEVRSAPMAFKSLIRGDWAAAYEERGRGGPMVVEGCPTCERAVTMPPDATLHFGCQHCGARSEVPAHEGILDVLPEVALGKPLWSFHDSRVAIGPYLHRSRMEGGMACLSCGGPLPQVEGREACPHCDATVLVLTNCGRRFVPGLRVQGHHEGTDMDGWMPVQEGLDYFDRYKRYQKKSSKATWGFVVWWLLGGVVMVCGGLGSMAWLVLHTSDDGTLTAADMEAGIGGFLGSMGFFALAAVLMIATPIWLNLKWRRELGLKEAPSLRAVHAEGAEG